MKNLIKILLVLSFALTACSHIPQPMDENIVKPILKEKPKLIYPLSAQKKNHSGTAHIYFSVSKEGIVTKTLVRESSGHKELDKAAENYCKGLIFTPAKLNNEPIEFGMRLELKFNLEDLEKEINNQIAEMKKLYEKANNSLGEKKSLIQKKILVQHSNIIDEVRDCQKFNEYVYGVLSEDVKKEWQSIAKSCPISFLLYHDFISRFKDYDRLDTLVSLLEYSLKQDLGYIDVTENPAVQNNRIGLIKKIKQFVENNYPDIILDYPDFEIEIKENNIS